MSLTTGAKYQVLSDADRKIIKAYGVFNEKEHSGIAHPSVFLIDQTGVIRFIYVGKDGADRPDDELLLNEIKKVSAAK